MRDDSARYCADLENKALDTLATKTVEPSAKLERSALKKQYFESFPEKIKILDEWKRWLQKPSPIKDGTKPDLAFRAILTSSKRPLAYRLKGRPSNWQ